VVVESALVLEMVLVVQLVDKMELLLELESSYRQS